MLNSHSDNLFSNCCEPEKLGDSERNSSTLSRPGASRAFSFVESVSSVVPLPPSGGTEFDYDDQEGLSEPRFDQEKELQPVQLEKRGVSSHQLQGNFWTSQTVFKNSIAAKLRTINMGEMANDLERCHTEITYAKCNGCSRVSKFLNRCDRFFCPECQPRLSRERKESVEWWTKEISQAKHVVLTLRNTGKISKKLVRYIKKCFSRLRRTKFAKNWKGGFYSIEVTNEGKGWHIHLHCLIDARYIDARQLSIEWNKATRKLGYIVKVKDCRNKSYLQEVTKYAVKGSDLAKWNPIDILNYIIAMDGVKQFGVFGSLYGKRTEFREWIKSIKENRATCECGCSSRSFHDERAWEVLEAQLTPQLASIPKPIPNSFEFGFIRELNKPTLLK